MKKIFTQLVITVFMLAVMVPFAIAGCSTKHSSAKKEAKADNQESALETTEAINTICPVMRGEVGKDTPYKVEYDGKVIGFCCASCIDEFNKDPDKYIQELGLGEVTE